MTTTSRTLHDYLTQVNPVLVEARRSRKSSKSSTTNTKWPLIKEIKQLKDFSWETLREISHRQLQQTLNQPFPLLDVPPVNAAQRRFSDERSLTLVLAMTNQSIVLEALSQTSDNLMSQNIQMVTGGQALLVFGHPKDDPDWAGTNDENARSNDQLPQNILPGDTKMSWNWKSSELKDCHLRDEKGYLRPVGKLWPVRQLLYYCLVSYSRYGYIITDKELVVIRVGPTQNHEVSEDDYLNCKNHVSRDAAVEYISIPRGNAGAAEELTVNLALWILHILAANNGRLGHRPYRSLEYEILTPGDPRPITLGTPVTARNPPQDDSQPEASVSESPPLQHAQEGDDEVSTDSDAETTPDTNEADNDLAAFSTTASLCVESAPSPTSGTRKRKRKDSHIPSSPTPGPSNRSARGYRFTT